MARATHFADSFHANPKILSIPKRHRNAAVGLFTRAFAFTGARTEDGYVFHPGALKMLNGTPAVVASLFAAGLWTEVPEGIRVDGEGELWTRSFSS